MARLPALLVALVLVAPAVRAQEVQTWDPSRDEGAPQQQLFDDADQGRTTPGARAGRRVVKGGQAAEPDSGGATDPGDKADQAPPEDTPLVKPKRRPKVAREQAPEEEGADAPDAAPRKATRKAAPDGEGQFGSRRIQVFLIPVGEAAGLAAGATQVALEGEVSKLPGFKPVDLVAELSVPPAGPDAQTLDEARRVISDGNKQLVGHAYDEAANRYRRAVRLLEKANWAPEARDFADAHARLGIALSLAGEEEAARAALQQAARFDLGNEIDGRQIDRKLGSALDAAREEVSAAGTGALSIVTSPAGARVFVGGVFKGTSPVTIDKAPAGINYVRIDSPGAFPVVQLVEVKEGFDVPVKAKLKYTPEASELKKTLQQVPRGLGSAATIPDMVRALGTRFRLERAVVSTVEMAKTNVATVRMCVFDFPRDARLNDESQDFQIDVEGGLEEAVGKWARSVFDRGDASRNRSAKDPLDRSDGTEDWYSTNTTRAKTIDAQKAAEEDADKPEWERGSYKPTTYRKGSTTSKDPLDHSDGTEDW